MREYTKIETLYERDLEGSKKLIEGKFRNPTIEFLKNNDWFWTEKIDGTNIRIHWDGHKVRFGARTDNGQIPTFLYHKLEDLFGNDEAEQLFEQLFGEREVMICGEGYGARIQKGGGKYIPNGVDFIMFDLLIGNNYQSREDVERCAKSFGLKVVPILGHGTLEEAVDFVKTQPNSAVAMEPKTIEGVVCRPKVELRDRCGNRLIVKIKLKDFLQ